ncbi:MAG TPA: GxxExxY protein, partial [Rhizomicrobium sp.]
LNTRGVGFVETLYENALAQELRDAGLLVEDVLLVEPQTATELNDVHQMQCTNYLKAPGLPLYLLLNFGKPRLEIKRWSEACEPHETICVFCVHLLLSAFKILSCLRCRSIVRRRHATCDPGPP